MCVNFVFKFEYYVFCIRWPFVRVELTSAHSKSIS